MDHLLAGRHIQVVSGQVAPKGAGSGGAGEPHVAICIAEWKGQPARCQAGWMVGDGGGFRDSG